MKTRRLLAFMLCLSACDQGSRPPPASGLDTTLTPAPAVHTIDTKALWLQSAGFWEDANHQIEQLNLALAALLQNPDASHLSKARAAWLNAHNRWQEASLLIDFSAHNPGLFATLGEDLLKIDAYPIAPGYLDTIAGYPHSGIVNDITLAINQKTLRAQHALTAPEEATLGFHVLEFLLWGENGQRPASDYARASAAAGTGITTINLPSNRRRDLLQLVGKLLQDDVQNLTQHWQNPGSPLARAYFSLPPASQLQLWQQGLQKLIADTAQSHCDFAKEPCSGLLARLQSAAALTQITDAARATYLPTPEGWHARLQALISTLESGEPLPADALTSLARALNEPVISQTPGQIHP